MSVKFECDGCSTSIEHRGPDLPPGWSSIGIQMRVMDNDGKAGTDSDDAQPSLFCRRCARDPDTLWDMAVREIRNMLRPRAA